LSGSPLPGRPNAGKDDTHGQSDGILSFSVSSSSWTAAECTPSPTPADAREEAVAGWFSCVAGRPSTVGRLLTLTECSDELELGDLCPGERDVQELLQFVYEDVAS
jgi:hypothetical protein